MERWTEQQVAVTLGKTRAELEQLRRSGKLAATRRWPRGWVYDAESVRAYAEEAKRGVAFADIVGIVKDIQAEVEAQRPAEPDLSNHHPHVKLIYAILANALDQGATDLYLVPGSGSTSVQFRIDNTTREVMPLPKLLHASTVRRLVLMAGGNPAQEGAPQVGILRIRHNEQNRSMRVSIIPGPDGALVSLRILRPELPESGLLGLGMPDAVIAQLQTALSQPGVVLFAGPPGSGTTTSAAAGLVTVAEQGHLAYTLEQPIEYEFTTPRVHRVAVHPEQGQTWESLLAAVLQTAPKVILVGSLQEPGGVQAARTAAQAGLTVLAPLAAANPTAAREAAVTLDLPVRLVVYQAWRGNSITFEPVAL